MLSRSFVTKALLILFIYGAGYVVARLSGFIVHSVVRDHSQNYMEHSVIAGDRGDLGRRLASTASAIYTPLRLVETRFWYWKQPAGTPLSKKHLEQLQQH